jgi:hypothetical protein
MRAQRTVLIRILANMAEIRDALKRKENIQLHREILLRIISESKDLLALAGDADELQRRQMMEDRVRRNATGTDWR